MDTEHEVDMGWDPLTAVGLGAVPSACEPRFPHLPAPENSYENQREIHVI